jgi:methylenetetrahydrofolate dehydrogenase (NADP+)/methenyltetrahydrofolate cyclohydrolase
MTVILDGNRLQKKIAEKLKQKIRGLKKTPSLVIFSANPSSESLLYIKKKREFGENLGCSVKHVSFKKDYSFYEYKKQIKKISSDKNVDGVIVQFPFNFKGSGIEVVNCIEANKDVDGLSFVNMSALFSGDEKIIPATTRGILEFFSYYNLPIKGKDVVIIGRSFLVGRPTALAFINRGATVTVCHTETLNLANKLKNADIIISATGLPNLVPVEILNSKQIVIDVGISAEEGGLIKGDVDFYKASKKVKAITPVPGGVGPLTVASLFSNLIEVTEKAIDS